MAKGSNRIARIKEKLAELFTRQESWSPRHLRKRCLDELAQGDSADRARLGDSIRRTVAQLNESGELLLREDGTLCRTQSTAAEPAREAVKDDDKSEKSKTAPRKKSTVKTPKEKDMRKLFDTLFSAGDALSASAVVSRAVEHFAVSGEQVHGVRGLALQLLKGMEKSGALSVQDGLYRLPVSVSPQPAVKASVSVRASRRASAPEEKAGVSRSKPAKGGVNEKTLLQRLNTLGGAFFTDFTVRLLTEYYKSIGCSVTGSFVVDGSEDRGIDAILHTQDALGLSDVVVIQAKTRSRGQVTTKELREFYGAMTAEGASRGLFITTSTFTTEAVPFLRRNPNLAGIDGAKLFSLAVRLRVGVTETDGVLALAPELT